MFDLQGSINALDPRNNSHSITRTLFVNIIDFVDSAVFYDSSAVVEQVYNSTFCLLKNARNLSPETLHFYL